MIQAFVKSRSNTLGQTSEISVCFLFDIALQFMKIVLYFPERTDFLFQFLDRLVAVFAYRLSLYDLRFQIAYLLFVDLQDGLDPAADTDLSRVVVETLLDLIADILGIGVEIPESFEAEFLSLCLIQRIAVLLHRSQHGDQGGVSADHFLRSEESVPFGEIAAAAKFAKMGYDRSGIGIDIRQSIDFVDDE